MAPPSWGRHERVPRVCRGCADGQLVSPTGGSLVAHPADARSVARNVRAAYNRQRTMDDVRDRDDGYTDHRHERVNGRAEWRDRGSEDSLQLRYVSADSESLSRHRVRLDGHVRDTGRVDPLVV